MLKYVLTMKSRRLNVDSLIESILTEKEQQELFFLGHLKRVQRTFEQEKRYGELWGKVGPALSVALSEHLKKERQRKTAFPSQAHGDSTPTEQ